MSRQTLRSAPSECARLTPARARPLTRLACVAFVTFLVAGVGCRRNATPDAAHVTERAGGMTGNTGATASDAAAPSPAGVRSERVTFRTADGWTLVGELAPGDTTRPAIILLHQLSSNRGEWAPLVARLHNGTGYTTFAIDGRGHGESTQGPDGPAQWPSFGNDPARWDGLRRDIDAAIAHVRGLHLAENGVIVIGASIGSTAAIRAAADQQGVRGIVMLSPGLAYHGLDTRDAFTRYMQHGGRALLIAGDGDTGSAEAVRALERIGQGANARSNDAGVPSGASPDHAMEAVQSSIVQGTGAHGVALAASGAHPVLWNEIADWIDRVALAPPIEPAGGVDVGARDAGAEPDRRVETGPAAR